MLSEARKYRLNIIIAEQSTAQQKDKQIIDILFANTGTVGTFKTASPQDEAIILPLFSPYVKKGEIQNLPAYHFYMKLGATKPEEPFSGVTVPVTLPQNTKAIEEMIKLSNKKYAVKEEEESEKEKPKMGKPFRGKQKPKQVQNTTLVKQKDVVQKLKRTTKRKIRTGTPENKK